MKAKHQAFNVYIGTRLIDVVFYSPHVRVDCEEVRRSLIDHDGYDYRIEARRATK